MGSRTGSPARGAEREGARPVKIRLAVTVPLSDDESKEYDYVFQQDEITVGRRQGCDIPIPVPEVSEEHVAIDPRFYRPAEVLILQGDYSKAEREIGWRPTVKFGELVEMMIAADLETHGASSLI